MRVYMVCMPIHLRYVQSKYLYFIFAIILVHNSNNDNSVSVLTRAYTRNSNFPEFLHARQSSGTDWD